ncbi:MAG: FMN-binding protein [Candidatus Atribacteria bacterium]|nr:FMN-binding protein [Candidatus Atribacteria bacterium]
MSYKKMSFISSIFLVIFLCVGVLWAESISNQIDDVMMNQLKSVFAGADSIKRYAIELPESDGDVFIQEIFQVFIEGEENGYIFKILSPGYRGDIVVLVAFSSKTNQIVGIQILEQSETPSLGDLITKPEFLIQFLKKSMNDQFELGGDIEAVSGATISSNAVAKACQKAAHFLLTIQAETETDNN